MKTKGGDDAVFQTMNRARELYRNKLQASTAADELASLFAECAIAEALPLMTLSSVNIKKMTNLPLNPMSPTRLFPIYIKLHSYI